MAWLKIDDNVPHHRKMLAAGPAASWLWLCGVAYCQRHKTDGHIPLEALPWLGVDKPRPLAAILVRVGLWHADDNIGGWLVHDFLDWNDSSDERDEKISDKSRRQQAWRERRRRERDASTRVDVDASTREAVDTAPTPTPTPPPPPTPRPLPPPDAPDGAVSLTLPPRPPKVPPGRRGVMTGPGSWGVRHASHVEGFCTFVCFPVEKFDEFVTRVVGAGATEADARAQVLEWAHAYRRDFRGIPGDDIWRFWSNAWAATHGSNRPAPSAGGMSHGDAVRGALEVIRNG